MSWQIEEIITKDGLILTGLFSLPKKPGRKAMLFVHGFPGNFYYGNLGILETLKKEFNRYGFGLASFNTRGHDIVSYSVKKTKSKKESYKFITIGAAFEKFEDCILDIEAGVEFLKSKGFNKIVVAGISGGTFKVAYYASRPHDKSVYGLVFLGPGSSVLIGERVYKKNLKILLEKAKQMIKKGRGNKLMPELLMKKEDFPISAQRFVSIYDEESNENVFPFYNPKAQFKILSRIEEPILVILGEKDKYLYNYRPDSVIEVLKQKAKKTKKFDFQIIKKATHGFLGKEKGLAGFITAWMEKL